MVVDDNVDLTEPMKMLLEMEGYEVIVANDGADALHKAIQFVPEVFLIDLGLPDMTGFDLATALRGSPALGNANLIALTGNAQPMLSERCMAAGFSNYLVKPVPIDIIIHTINSAGLGP
jgi:CheY-like chemotaxis protein